MRNTRYLLHAFILLLLVMFILPYYSAEGYLISRNTTSHLGAQNTPNAWIMNVTFILLGITSILEGWIHLKQYWIHKIILTIFGLGLVFVAIFQHAPIINNIPYNLVEDKIHSIFATTVGFSFTLFAFSVIFIEKSYKKRILAMLVGLADTGLSILIFSVSNYAGIWQRLIFIVSFAWLIFFFEEKKIRQLKNSKI